MTFSATKAAKYLYGEDLAATNHDLNYLLEHFPENADNHCKKIAIAAGSTALAVVKARNPDISMDSVKAGFPPELDNEKCLKMIEEMEEIAAPLAAIIDRTPDPLSAQEIHEAAGANSDAESRLPPSWTASV